jgi:hypothetical protein
LQIAGGPLVSGININSNNVPADTITQDRFADGFLPNGTTGGFLVTDSNINAGSIKPSALAAGDFPADVKITESNVPANTVPAAAYACLFVCLFVCGGGGWGCLFCAGLAQFTGVAALRFEKEQSGLSGNDAQSTTDGMIGTCT